MTAQQIRQGDIYLRPALGASRTGTQTADGARVRLAYGNATGHAHVVEAAEPEAGLLPPAQCFDQPDGRRFLFVDRPCVLRHDEHDQVTLAPGAYEVIRQREYVPGAIRQVED